MRIEWPNVDLSWTNSQHCWKLAKYVARKMPSKEYGIKGRLTEWKNRCWYHLHPQENRIFDYKNGILTESAQCSA